MLRLRTRGWRGSLWVWLPVVLALVVVVIESTGTFSSEHTSGWIRPIFERLFGPINDEVWAVGHYFARKSGHFSGYGLLGLSWLRLWLIRLALRPDVRGWRLRAFALAITCTFCVASLDEWHQTFIPSRTGLFSDVLLDTCGAAMMCGLVALLFWSPALTWRRVRQ